jgi:hypothetical protein
MFQRNKSPSSALLATCFLNCFLLGLFFDPEEGGDMFPETSVIVERTARLYNVEDMNFHIHSRENLKYYINSRW